MVKWAKYLIKERNKVADSRVILNLVDIAGESVVHLNNEINRICLLIEPRTQIKIEDLGVEIKKHLSILKVEEPAKRQSGIMLKTVDELVDKLKNEAKVI